MAKQFRGVTPPPPKKTALPPATATDANGVDRDDSAESAPPAAKKTPAKKAPKKRKKSNKDLHNPNRQPNPAGTGRPVYVPSEHDMEQVKALAGYGMTIFQIIHILGISEDTWDKHAETFSPLVEQGKAMAAASVSQALFNGAVAGDTGKIIWYEKTRAGRSDKVIVEASGPGGAPIQTEAEVTHAGEVTQNIVGRIGIYLPDNGRQAVPGSTPTPSPA